MAAMKLFPEFKGIAADHPLRSQSQQIITPVAGRQFADAG
jgi:hypothetical protein